jgi:F-type H+-transporting ATPase subunit b
MLVTGTTGVLFGNMIIVSGSLLLLLLLLKKFAWKNIVETLEKRAQKIATDIDEAEKSNVKAKELQRLRQEQLASSREEATAIIKNARETGEKSRQMILAETQEEAVHLKEKARDDIEQERIEVLASVKDEVADLSVQLASKILKTELAKGKHQTLIDSFIGKLGDSL